MALKMVRRKSGKNIFWIVSVVVGGGYMTKTEEEIL